MMELHSSIHHNPQYFIAHLPQPGTISTDEALQWGEKCNQQHVGHSSDWSGLALSHLAYQFYVEASFSKNSAVSGEAYYRLWQIESEGRAPHSTNNSRENRKKGKVYLRLSAVQGYPAAQKLLSTML